MKCECGQEAEPLKCSMAALLVACGQLDHETAAKLEDPGPDFDGWQCTRCDSVWGNAEVDTLAWRHMPMYRGIGKA